MAKRPELSDVSATTAEAQYGIVYEVIFERGRRDFAGPFASKEEAEAALPDLNIERDAKGILRAKVAVWDERRVRLAQAMKEHGIRPNRDYDFSDLLEILSGEQECGRYAVQRSDETYTILDVCDTLKQAESSLADSIKEDTLNRPDGVLDLDTGQMATPQISVSLSFD